MEYAIFIFDGVCNFCNGFVNFIIDHDPKKILKKYKISHNKIVDSLILIEGEKYTTRSTAFFHIVKYLTFPYFLLHAGIIVPKFLRDYIYEFIGKNRYKWFGKRKICRTPTKELKERFL